MALYQGERTAQLRFMQLFKSVTLGDVLNQTNIFEMSSFFRKHWETSTDISRIKTIHPALW